MITDITDIEDLNCHAKYTYRWRMTGGDIGKNSLFILIFSPYYRFY